MQANFVMSILHFHILHINVVTVIQTFKCLIKMLKNPRFVRVRIAIPLLTSLSLSLARSLHMQLECFVAIMFRRRWWWRHLGLPNDYTLDQQWRQRQHFKQKAAIISKQEETLQYISQGKTFTPSSHWFLIHLEFFLNINFDNKKYVFSVSSLKWIMD